MNPEDTWRKFRDLKKMIHGIGKAAIAFSGGVDSFLLLTAAQESCSGQVIAVTIDSCFFPRRELNMAAQLASTLAVEHLIIKKKGFPTHASSVIPRSAAIIARRNSFRRCKKKSLPPAG